MTHNEISSQVIQASIEVHRELGPGLLEGVYELCLVQVLKDMGLRVDQQVPVPITFRGKDLGASLRLDIIVEDMVIVEVKAVEALHDSHIAQLLTYLKLTGCQLGLLINFNEALLRKGLRRVVNGLVE